VLDNSGSGYDLYRPQLFAMMLDHYLVIVGNDRRVPPRLRRAFFRQIVRHYRRYRPADGYPVPGGVPGLKHHLVRHGSYEAYALLRAFYRRVPRSRVEVKAAPPAGERQLVEPAPVG